MLEDDNSSSMEEFESVNIDIDTDQNSYPLDNITGLTPLSKNGQSVNAHELPSYTIQDSSQTDKKECIKVEDPPVAMHQPTDARIQTTHVSKDEHDPIEVTDFGVRTTSPLEEVCNSTQHRWRINTEIVSQIRKQTKKFGETSVLVPKLANIKRSKSSHHTRSCSKYTQTKRLVDHLMKNEELTTPHHQKLQHRLMYDLQCEVARLQQIEIGNMMHMYLLSTTKHKSL